MSILTEQVVRAKNGRTVTIRSAVPDDAPRVLVHARTVIAEGEFLLSTLDDFRMIEETEAAWLRMNLEDPNKLVIIAESEGQVLGVLNFHNGERKRILHQGEMGITVHRDWRDQGIGRAMMTSWLQWARENPTIEKVCLEVFANNPRAIALYTSLGFSEEGRFVRRIKMGPGSYVDTIYMGLWVGEDL